MTLDGHLRPIKGVLPIAVQTKASGFQSLIVPSENAKEAAVVDGLDVYGFNQSILSFVGEPVAVQGQEYTHNGWSVLITSADKIEYK